MKTALLILLLAVPAYPTTQQTCPLVLKKKQGGGGVQCSCGVQGCTCNQSCTMQINSPKK